MPLSRSLALITAGLVLAVGGCGNDVLEMGAPQPIDNPAAPGSLAPNLAVGLDGNLYLSWIEPHGSGHALRFSTWQDRSWSTPRTVSSGDNWFVNWADFPSMAALDDGTLAAHWLEMSGGAPYAYDVRIALSHDEGITWSDPIRPHLDGTQTEHGFATLVPTVEDEFGVVWLDGRNTGQAPRGPMTLRYAALGSGGELRSEAVIDESVCDCCSTDALRTEDGAMIVAYRDRSASEIRDISVSRLPDSTWSAPRTVYADNWEIAGCPVNGPALASNDSRVATAWFTMAQDSPAVRVAFSDDLGKSFGRPIRIDDGNPIGRVDAIMLDDGSALVSWLEQKEDDTQILIRRIGPSRAFDSTLVASASGSRSSGFPRMVRFEDNIVLAWTQPGDRSRVITFTLPMTVNPRSD